MPWRLLIRGIVDDSLAEVCGFCDGCPGGEPDLLLLVGLLIERVSVIVTRMAEGALLLLLLLLLRNVTGSSGWPSM